jgi:cytochrome c5
MKRRNRNERRGRRRLIVAAVSALSAISALTLDATVITSQDSAQPEKGEQIMNASCRTCHDLRPIETHALNEKEWTREVESMIEQGAEISKADIPVLVEYLTRMHGPLPDGPGKEILLSTCTQCHDLMRIRRQGRSPEGWLEVLEAMLNEGAPLSEQDLPVLLRYLARNFKPER